jgi:hypothetical protein
MTLNPGLVRLHFSAAHLTVAVLGFAMALAVLPAVAQPGGTPPAQDSARSNAPPAPTLAKPAAARPQQTSPAKSGWSLLTADQQRALQPLAQSWGSLSDGQQRKWLEISRNYPSLSSADKAKMHSRMSAWVALSPRERAEARLNFAATNELSKELSPQEKQAKWETYQSLSPEEKRKLAEAGVRPPVGAALPARPVAPKKLATLPPADTAAKAPKISTPPAAVSQQSVPAE